VKFSGVEGLLFVQKEKWVPSLTEHLSLVE